MASFTEAERVNIRMYLGYSSTFLQADPRLENAITSIQAAADGGTRPDASAATQCRAFLTSLAAVDSALDSLDAQQGVLTLDQGQGGTILDAARETLRLNMKGRRLVHRLARMLDTAPRADAFAGAPRIVAEYPSPVQGGRSPY